MPVYIIGLGIPFLGIGDIVVDWSLAINYLTAIFAVVLSAISGRVIYVEAF